MPVLPKSSPRAHFALLPNGLTDFSKEHITFDPPVLKKQDSALRPCYLSGRVWADSDEKMTLLPWAHSANEHMNDLLKEYQREKRPVDRCIEIACGEGRIAKEHLGPIFS